MAKPDFDVATAHAYFAAHCFNRAWKGIDAKQRTEEEAESMLGAAHASLWHWLQRPECTNQNRSIGYWQLSRVYALLGDAQLSMQFAKRCLDVSLEPSLPPLFVGYAYEALARAAKLQGDAVAVARWSQLGKQHCDRVESEESRQLLEADLSTL